MGAMNLLSNPAATLRSHGPDDAALQLKQWLQPLERVFVLTGAGCSTASGIPDYRDTDGQWKRTPPVTYQAFTGDARINARYWARSFIGWPRMAQAHPNDVHRALARYEDDGRISRLITQNVDGLHQRAGSREVIDLHGRIDAVVCLGCAAQQPRARRAGTTGGDESRLGRARGRDRARRRRRSRRPRLFTLSCAGLRPLRRHAQARRGVLRRERSASPLSPGARRPDRVRRGAGGRLVADGLFGLPLRAASAPKPACRSRSSTAVAPAPTIWPRSSWRPMPAPRCRPRWPTPDKAADTQAVSAASTPDDQASWPRASRLRASAVHQVGHHADHVPHQEPQLRASAAGSRTGTGSPGSRSAPPPTPAACGTRAALRVALAQHQQAHRHRDERRQRAGVGQRGDFVQARHAGQRRDQHGGEQR